MAIVERAEPAVRTTSGRVRGRLRDGVTEFLGIPYAAPPVGPLRFRAPVRPARWEGTRPCLEFGPVCPQHDFRDENVMVVPMPEPWEARRQQEDCLNLNIWTPAADHGDRPVLMWVHGGAFVVGSGSSPNYDGASLARRGVVVVTINYRLGGLGYLHLGPLGGDPRSANLGQLDQIAALEWVQDNIAAFGGDPDNVTTFGESAGGMAVGTLLAMPGARGLFRRAIAQSGAGHHCLSAEAARGVAQRFCELTGLDPRDRDAVEALPVDHITKATLQLRREVLEQPERLLGDEAHLGMPLMPVVGTDALPQTACDAVADGRAAGVDLLVGTTRDEAKVFTVEPPSDAIPPRYLSLFTNGGQDPEDVRRTYATDLGGEAQGALSGTLSSDGFFWIPAIRLAEAQQRTGSTTYMYRFDWSSPVFGGALGAHHGLDVPFVFGTVRSPICRPVVGDDPPGRLVNDVQQAWVAFAGTGNPTHPGIPAVAPYEAGRRTTLILDTPCRVIEDPDAARRRAWDGVL
jgi:para-nitrobenzyl esterase